MNATPSTYEPRRFRANVPFYARYRLGYPDSLIDHVSKAVGLNPDDRVLDLGCGPGLLAIPFARGGMVVTAVDPEPEMLTDARAAAAEAGVPIDIREGSSFAMPSDIGMFNLVTMGRSFHSMDRVATLKILEGFVLPDGALALFHDAHQQTAENRWRRLLHEISNEYGRAHSPYVRESESPEFRSHEAILLDSAFCEVERVGVFIRRELTADDIVGLAYSLSSSSPEKLGGRASAFERDLRVGLAHLSPDGRFVEIAELTAIVARRP